MLTANFYSTYVKAREPARLPALENALPRWKIKVRALPVSPRLQSEVYLLLPCLGNWPLRQQTTTSSI